MAELTPRETWFIDVCFKRHYGFGGSPDILQIKSFMFKLSCGDADTIVKSLLSKNVLSLSPDGRKVKFTDYGLSLYRSLQLAQDEWEKEPIILAPNLAEEQILVRAGKTFTANRILREIVSQARSQLRIIDPYFGQAILDLIQDMGLSLEIQVILSAARNPSAIAACKAFQTQYRNAKFRTADEEIHDRYVICDDRVAYHLGHSLKNLGTKDTQINKQKDVGQVIRLFEERWAKAKPV